MSGPLPEKEGNESGGDDGKAAVCSLWNACAEGNVQVVKALLSDPGLDPNTPTHPNGSTPFYAACDGSHLAVVELLLQDPRTDPCRRLHSGRTALHAACSAGNPAMVQRLLQDGRIPVNAMTQEGWSCLHSACGGGSPEVIKLLLSHKQVDPAVVSRDHYTPLHLACMHGKMDAVKMLLANDPNVDIRKKPTDNLNPHAAIVLAGVRNYMDIVGIVGLFELSPAETRHMLREELGLP